MVIRFSKLLAFLLIATALPGCKLAVISTPFGNISSSNPAYDCAGGSVCEIELPTGFNATFTATASPGYKFVKWQTGAGANNGGFQCANSTNPVCTVSIPYDANGAAIAALQDIGFLMPLYNQL